MQALITLGIAFSVLVTYFESSVQAVSPQQHSAKVVRSAKFLPEQPTPQPLPQLSSHFIEASAPAEEILPLNLKVPAAKALYRFYLPPKKSTLQLLKRSSKPEITYNAELVYDLEKGESITGGKVNITIPFG